MAEPFKVGEIVRVFDLRDGTMIHQGEILRIEPAASPDMKSKLVMAIEGLPGLIPSRCLRRLSDSL